MSRSGQPRQSSTVRSGLPVSSIMTAVTRARCSETAATTCLFVSILPSSDLKNPVPWVEPPSQLQRICTSEWRILSASKSARLNRHYKQYNRQQTQPFARNHNDPPILYFVCRTFTCFNRIRKGGHAGTFHLPSSELKVAVLAIVLSAFLPRQPATADRRLMR